MVDAHQNVKTYSYSDRSGDEKSIDITKGQSAAYNVINQKSTSQEIQDKWNGLSTTAKIGIGCGILGGLLLCAIAFTFYCIKERRAGKRERALADQAWDTQQAEMLEYRNRMKTGAFAVGYRPKVCQYHAVLPNYALTFMSDGEVLKATTATSLCCIRLRDYDTILFYSFENLYRSFSFMYGSYVHTETFYQHDD